MEKVEVGLVKGRHEMPVSRYVFEAIADPTDFEVMALVASDFVLQEVGIIIRVGRPLNSADYTDLPCYTGARELVVYVTGLTAATAAVIKVCAIYGVHLTLMHYDRTAGGYVPQRIF